MFQGMSMFDVASNENAGIRDRALQAAQLGRGRVAVYAAGLEGGMMAQGLARMAGMKTPEEEKSEAINTIMSQNANKDPNNPADLLHISRQFVAAGLPNYAQQFRDKARDVEVQNRTSAQTDRELDQRDARLTFDQEKFKGDTEYRTSSLEFQDKEFQFRQEKEETRIQELADQLALDKAELQRKLKTGEFQEIVGKDGNTALYQITSDEEGNVSIKPVTIDVVQASSGGGATQGSSTTTSGATTTSNVGYQSDGALITKYADRDPVEEIDKDAETVYKNLEQEYQNTFRDRNQPMMSSGSLLAVPETGEFSTLESVPDLVDFAIYKTIEKIEDRGGVVDSMYDLYMGPGSEAMEAIMKNNGMGALWAENKARFEKEGDTTLYSMTGRQSLIDGTLKGIVTSPIAFDVKLKQDHTTDDGTVLAKKGETFDTVMSRLMTQDITAVTRDDDGNITGFQPPEQSAFFNFNDDLVRYIAQDIVSKEEGFKGLPEITGTADTRLPDMDYGNQNVREPEVTAELIGNQSSTVMGDTTEFDKVVQENGNILADTVKDIKEFVIDIFKPSEHKDSAPENPISSGYGSDKWALRLLSIKVPQFETAEKTDDGRYQLKMPPVIDVKDGKAVKAYTDWRNLNFNYFFRQGIELPLARVKKN